MTAQAHILIVDDNPSMTKTLADVLAAKGYVVHAAYSGAEALKILHDQPVDIMLTDVRMPDLNGVELYREIRKTGTLPLTFLMTAYAADDIIQEGLEEGIKTVLTKPLDIDFLLTLLSAAVRAYVHRE
ncbi:MAG: Response regulator receiver protein [Anaerolineales bacterium]|nr:Response regulator receiver protein [Anaerolineales bacterium]